ncbi:metal ion transporter [Penicillium canariense]|uniref:Metal ion transporter n=1 Tax=Penicillium canariense TaxID=189055 RepID=A0A9W9LQD6_9EURO|nr:metal ion transporter [Penicillium canariense]KAJ5169151.1 metal ion transporter [Penicillium canariense]
MSDTPRSEKELCLTRYSTPVPELDDHRFHLDAVNTPRIEAPREEREEPLSRQHTAAQQGQGAEMAAPERQDLLQVQDALREAAPVSRDFEQAVVDDDRPEYDVAGIGRRFSVDPTANFHTPRRISCVQQDLGNMSCASSVSARSSSPPNSVEAFADPRRRERANTMESQVAPDLEAMLQRTVSGGTLARRPTFSNASAIRPPPGDISVCAPEEPGVAPTYDEPGRIPVIDYEELEEFVALNQQRKVAAGNNHRRKHSLSSQSMKPRVFYDLRPGVKSPDVQELKQADSGLSSDAYEACDEVDEKATGKVLDEKVLVATLPNINEPTRFGFFSSESQTTVHAAELGDLVLPGDSFRDLFQLGPEGGVWWLDVVNPTEEELGAISRAFSIHPLTTEDILTQEAREKVELFKQYYFVCFRTFYQMDKTSEEFLEPVNFYMVVFRDGVLTFSFVENPHAESVRKRIGKLRDYVSLSSDWICYAMIDDIVDSFGPVIRDVELESEAIEDHVFIARVDDFESFLPRIGGLRKKVMSLMRLLGGKADVIRGFSKRCNEQYSVTPRGDIGLYLGDIQDHVVTMMSNLAHFEKMLSRSHTNYLAQLNVTNLVLGNHTNKVLSKVTLIATILVPMNLICGLFGMNVNVPGKNDGGLGWFFGIMGLMGAIVVLSMCLARWQKLV